MEQDVGREAGELLALVAKLGTQGEEEQEEAVRLQLQGKLEGFLDTVSVGGGSNSLENTGTKK